MDVSALIFISWTSLLIRFLVNWSVYKLNKKHSMFQLSIIEEFGLIYPFTASCMKCADYVLENTPTAWQGPAFFNRRGYFGYERLPTLTPVCRTFSYPSQSLLRCLTCCLICSGGCSCISQFFTIKGFGRLAPSVQPLDSCLVDISCQKFYYSLFSSCFGKLYTSFNAFQ